LIDKPSFSFSTQSNIDLFNNALIIEIESICRYDYSPCCDSLPTNVQIFGDNVLCLPLDEYYDIEVVTTTTKHPDTVYFTEDLSASLEDGKVKLTFTVDTYYHSDFTYFVELVSQECTKRLSLAIDGSSNVQEVYIDDTYGNNTYRIYVAYPEEAYSNTVFLENTTTSTTEAPDPELTTSYTTEPPPVPPILEDLLYLPPSGWQLSWNLRNDLQDLSEILIEYNTGGSWQRITYTPDSPEWNSLETGHTVNITTDTCAEYSFRVAAKRRQSSYSNSLQVITATLPGEPLNLSAVENPSDATVLDIDWEVPSDNGGCTSLTYTVEYRESGSQNWIPHVANVTYLSTAVTGLDPSKEYFARVRATNIAGDGPWATTDPYSQLLLHLDYAYDDPDSDAILTPDSSSYGRTVQCHVGYINEPAIPEEYFGGDNVKFGDGSFSPDLDTCPVDFDIYDNLGWDYNHKYMRFRSSRMLYNNEAPWFNNNSTINAYDGANNKLTIEYWLKIPSFGNITNSASYPPILDLFGEALPIDDYGYNQITLGLNSFSTTGVSGVMSFDHYYDENTSSSNYRYYYINTNSRIQNQNIFSITDNDWHHVALVIDSSLNNSTDQKFISVYLDGILSYNTSVLYDESVTGISDYYSVPITIDDIGFGVPSDYFFQYNDKAACFHLDEFRLSTQIMYCSNFTPPSTTFDQIIGEEPC
jgi:hypothetical protein